MYSIPTSTFWHSLAYFGFDAFAVVVAVGKLLLFHLQFTSTIHILQLTEYMEILCVYSPSIPFYLFPTSIQISLHMPIERFEAKMH